MLGTKKEKDNTPPVMLREGDLTCNIAEGTVIEGRFSTSENIRIDGKVLGDVYCDKKIVMGEKAVITGKVNAFTAAIRGNIKGDLIVQDILHLQETAKVDGNITAKSLLVENGAHYSGACKIG
ncbi:MAG: polymer-forming cytoskeletal protein [Saprospiraceae bacterium]|nr:polymer-forming cytoskeletal protein [Saprospiraceae bacterium]